MANAIKDKSFTFAVRIVGITKRLQRVEREYVLSKQLLRSGTAIGALVREAQEAESRPDFVHKLAIALKEANEAAYWIELLHETGYLPTTLFDELRQGVLELLSLLTAIITSSKKTTTRPARAMPSRAI